MTTLPDAPTTFTKDSWAAGETAYFEYHCNRSHDSEDAPQWYRSHDTVTVLRFDHEGSADTLDRRLEIGEPSSYIVRFEDGFEGGVFEDELFTSPDGFDPEMGPPSMGEIMAANA